MSLDAVTSSSASASLAQLELLTTTLDMSLVVFFEVGLNDFFRLLTGTNDADNDKVHELSEQRLIDGRHVTQGFLACCDCSLVDEDREDKWRHSVMKYFTIHAKLISPPPAYYNEQYSCVHSTAAMVYQR